LIIFMVSALRGSIVQIAFSEIFSGRLLTKPEAVTTTQPRPTPYSRVCVFFLIHTSNGSCECLMFDAQLLG
jgi:hypothetical protein